MEHVKVGILGIGFIGETHLRNCLLIRNVEVAVADSSKSAIRKAKNMGVKEVYRDYHDLLAKSDLDAVVVALPHFLHKESVCLAAERGCDVLVEKPLGLTAQECKEIISCTKKHGVKLMVGFNRRFFDHNRTLKLMIEDGVLGEIQLISCVTVYTGPIFHRFPPKPVPEWWLDHSKSGGGVVIDAGSHVIDLMRWLMSSDVQVEYALLDHKYRLPVEDTAILTLRFKDLRTRAVLLLGWFTSGYAESMTDVYGTVKSISSKTLIPQRTKITAREAAKNIVQILTGKETKASEAPPFSPSHYTELEHFIDCVREDKEPLVTGEDGLECAKVIDKVYELSRQIGKT